MIDYRRPFTYTTTSRLSPDGYGVVTEALQVAVAAYGMFGPKPKVNLDVPVYTPQPPPPTPVNWTPVIIMAAFGVIGLTLIMTKPKRKSR